MPIYSLFIITRSSFMARSFHEEVGLDVDVAIDVDADDDDAADLTC